MEQTNDDAAVVLYPNPSEGQFTVQLSGGHAAEMRIEVMDALGRVIYTDLSQTEEGIPSTRQISLPSSVASGMYMVRIQDGEQTYSQRLVVQRD